MDIGGHWLVRVCDHGHRVEWRGNVDRWQHMDADDGGYCSAGNEVVEVVRAAAAEGAVEALERIETAFANDDGRGQSHNAIRAALLKWRSTTPRGQ